MRSIVVIGFVLLFLMVGHCAVAVGYQAWDLGLVGATSSGARGINSLGYVAGNYTDASGASRPVMWNPNGSTSILAGADAWASDINDLGQVVGSLGGCPTIWDANGVKADLPTPIGASSCVAYGTSRNGWIAGSGLFPGARTGAVIWSPEHVAQGIWSDSPFVETYSANAINDAGVAVGSGTHGFSPPAAFVFSNGGNPGMLAGGVFGPSAVANAINDQGCIAGRLDSHAVVWNTDGTVSQYELGTAYGINDAGLVVGESGGFGAAWESGVLTQLAPLSGMTSSAAFDVNENGWIVGTSTDASGHSHATLWRPAADPVPEPSTIVYALLCGLGGISGIRRRMTARRA